MADFYTSSDSRNYLIGGHVATLDGVDVGNIVSGVITPVMEEIQVYNALLGRVGPDYHEIPEEVVSDVARMDVALTLDEVTRDNLHVFLGGARDGTNTILPLLRRRIHSSLLIEAVSDTGINFTWEIPKVIVTPAGDLSYQTDNWVTLAINCEVFPNADTPDTPFGELELLGANIG